MSASGLAASPPLARALTRWERNVLVGCALGASGLAWWALATAEPRPGGPEPAALAAMWLLMMAAMMLPAMLPWLVTLAALAKRPPSGSARSTLPAGTAGLFAVGYFAAWLPVIAVGTVLQLRLQGGGHAGAGAAVPAPVAGAALAAAGLYQLSAIKGACLRHCRSPLSFLLTHWRNGPVGTLRMGVSHGMFCLGCCWALMALGLLLGGMSVGWMAALTVVVCAEKLAARGRDWARWLGLGLVSIGVLTAFVA